WSKPGLPCMSCSKARSLPEVKYIGRRLLSAFGQKEKPQTFFKICGLAGETEKGAVMLDNTLFLPDYSVVLTCPVFRCPKKH
ncbi:hypothetical protein, partial [Pseudoflavonifractor phocaeensis]|uniref:hypothetical protein n=1 Tax=Pseudoflavonifractor phocaeensis TaxID=1870988 RepID=UPI001957D84F